MCRSSTLSVNAGSEVAYAPVPSRSVLLLLLCFALFALRLLSGLLLLGRLVLFRRLLHCLSRQDLLLELIALLLPSFHLVLVELELGLQSLELLWNVCSRDRSAELQLVEQLESLSVVLDGLRATLLSTFVLRLPLFLQGSWGVVELFLSVLLAEQNLRALRVGMDGLLFLLLLRRPLVLDQVLAEEDRLLDERDLCDVWLLIHSLSFSHALRHLPLRLLGLPFLVDLVLPRPALLILPLIEVALFLAELIPQSVSLLHLRFDLLPDLITLLDVRRQVAQLLLAALVQSRQGCRHLALAIPIESHFLIDCADVLPQIRTCVARIQIIFHLPHLPHLGPVSFQFLNLLQIILLFLQSHCLRPKPQLNVSNTLIDGSLTGVTNRLLHLGQLISHVCSFLFLVVDALVQSRLPLHQLIYLLGELVKLSAVLVPLRKILIFATGTLADLGCQLGLLCLETVNGFLDLLHGRIELLSVRWVHFGPLILFHSLHLLRLGLGAGLGVRGFGRHGRKAVLELVLK